MCIKHTLFGVIVLFSSGCFKKSYPYVHYGAQSLVNWSNDELRVQGVVRAINQNERIDNKGYQFWMFNISKNIFEEKIECDFYNTLVVEDRVALPEKERCELIKYDLNKKQALVAWKNIKIEVKQESVKWSSNDGDGVLITVFDFLNQ